MSAKALTRDAILKIDDLKKEEVNVPEWGGTIFVRSLTGLERDTFEEKLFSNTRKGQVNTTPRNIRAAMVAFCAVDEEGNRLFSESDIEALGKKSAAALNRIFEAAQRLNGWTSDDVEEMAKN